MLSHADRGDRLQVDFNESECTRARSHFGYVVLADNAAQDTFEALGDYRLRERGEELFQDWRGQADGRRQRRCRRLKCGKACLASGSDPPLSLRDVSPDEVAPA